MIYVIGTKFTAGTSGVPQGGSVQQQLMQEKLNRKAAEKTPFESGKEYSIYYIKSFIEENIQKLKYTFLNSETRKTIDMDFPDSAEAEDYIARVGGMTESLKQERSRITKHLNNVT